jgi:1,2-dihydroxy-3-keto-5-methylthiopentene dioxygenase
MIGLNIGGKMSLLTVWNETDPTTTLLQTTKPSEIAAELKTLGVSFDQWPVIDLPQDAAQDDLLAAYGAEVEKISTEQGYIKVDVVRLHNSGQSDWREIADGARAKFLNEHKHDDDEVRFFVEGAGVFYLHLNGKVYAVLCEAGDLMSVPEGTTHWFDMGTEPSFAAIRFFHDDDGWIGDFTGSDISSKFADFDQLMEIRKSASA